MPFSIAQKNKINLSDYDYKEDIKNRILMSNLTFFQVDVLKELVNGSLKNSVGHLSEQLESSKEDVVAALKKLESSKLFSLHGDIITINKSVRKYYESQIEKFDEDFKPDIEFLQGILNKVPIEVLPVWYSLSKNSNNIFASIIDKFLITPKVYSAYLDQLEFDSEILDNIIRDLYESPEIKIPSADILKKYSIKKEQLEEYLLILEYNFVCCINYCKKGKNWEEVITPFYEWREYCLLEKKSIPNSISDEKNIQRLSSVPKAHASQSLATSPLYTPRNMREIERNIKIRAQSGWVYFDDFLKGFTASVNNKETPTLKNKGKRWEYQISSYTFEELDFIKAVLTERFLEIGFIEIGLHKKKLCFSLTPLGKMSINNS